MSQSYLDEIAEQPAAIRRLGRLIAPGLIDSVKSAGAVVQEFKEDFADAVEHMNMLMEE